MVSKEKINLLIISAIIVFAMIIAYPFYAPSKHNLYVLNLNENVVNNNFNYLKSSSSNSAKSHKRKHKEEIDENLVSPSEFAKMNKVSVDLSLGDEGLAKKNYAIKSNKKEDFATQGSSASGVYFAKGKSRTVRTVDVHSSQGFIASNTQENRPFISNPQYAPNDVTDGGDPGGDPTGDPLPLKDNLIILILLSLIYVIKKSRLK